MEKGSGAVTNGVRGHAVATVDRPADELYAFWRDEETAPLWQERVRSVVRLSGNKSRWVMEGPFQKSLEWVSEVVEDEPGRRIVWQTVSGDVNQRGEVEFSPAPAGRGTIVSLTQTFQLPGGKVANAAAGLLARSPRQMVVENLRHFKQLMEAGEIPTTENQPSGARGVSGKVKEFVYGETNPAPPGTPRQGSGTTRSA